MIQALARAMAKRPLWHIDAVGAGLIGLAAGVWYFAGVEPLQQAQAGLRAMEVELASQRDVAHTKAKLASTQDRELARLRAEIEASAIQLRREDALNAHVSKLTAVAEGFGLRVNEIKPSAATRLPRFTVVPIRLSGVGGYGAVVEFLRRLRADFGDTGLTGLTLERSPAVGDAEPDAEVDLKFVVNLAWYAAPVSGTGKK
ncbi:MAG: type 4a pilus biogenesis protein PilO [Phycisphaeraceae bacterium]|nr:type 4a pilus biogenesis protein PilO [Phycisphaeraceae bacterium]